MNNSVQANEQFNYKYSSVDSTDKSETFIDLANNYYKLNLVQYSPLGHKLNLVCQVDNENYMSMDDLRSNILDNFLSTYLEPVIKEAEDSGIKSLVHFRVWIQGNHERLKYPCSQLGAHTHLDGNLYGTGEYKDNIITHTVIIPLLIKNTITESLWAKWIDNPDTTITPKLKVISLMGIDKVPPEITTPAFCEWWEKLKETNSTNEVALKFPDNGQKLTIDFNSKNFLHGVDTIGNNLYLIVLFDRCKR
jgi:hypothetical protein